jgi:RNA-directed DNA polymerase
MKGPYVEDLASRGGPESCVGDPRGRSEALTGVHAGRLLSLENSSVQGADAVVGAEGNTAGGVIASRWRALRGRRTRARVRAPHAENREISRSPSPGDYAPSWMVRGVACQRAAGREGNAEAVIPR